MTEIRDLLDREASKVQPRLGDPADFSTRFHHLRERRERRRRLGAGILGVLAGAVAIAAAVTVLRPAGGPAPRELGPAPSAGVTVTNFSLGGENHSLAYGFGSVWVAGYDPEGAYVLRIDPRSGEVVARIAASVMGWEEGGDGLAVGHGSVWAVGGTVQRIDPSTGVVQVINELDFSGVAVAVAERDLWVAVMDQYQAYAPAEVIRLDPGTGEVLARVSLPEGFGFVHRILPTSGALWVYAMRTDGMGVHEPSLIAIDPRTDEVVAVRPYPGVAVATDGESLWALRYLREAGSEESSWAVVRLDGATGEVLQTVPIGAERVGELLPTGTGVWFIAGDDVHATLDRLDPSTGSVEIVAELGGRGGVVDMEASAGSVWFLRLDYPDGPLSTLSRIDLP